MTQSELKYVRSLQLQKYRKVHNAYLIEGDKLLKEWLHATAYFEYIIMTQEWYDVHKDLLQNIDENILRTVPYFQLEKLTSHKTAPQVIAVVKNKVVSTNITKDDWVIVLDAIQDPGNVGTIIRIADWFGIPHIIALPDTVEVYNPKVIQASMGSILRIQLHQYSWEDVLSLSQPLIATAMQGTDLNKARLHQLQSGAIIFGNESKGVHPEILKNVQQQITIPRYGAAESLNVGVACGIVCAAIKIT